jgi:predicted AlkP superfamily pyrophosphatase or phosphodiesterase
MMTPLQTAYQLSLSKFLRMIFRFLFSIIAFFFLQTSSAQKIKNDAIHNGVERPKLVVGLVVDQMRWDYLYRYYNRYTAGGFKRLLNKGFSFENTMIPYTPTVTGAGHAALYTGSVPAFNGIVGNEWLEKATGEYMYCAQDKSVQTVGSTSNQGQMSPKNLLATTIGDELRLATNFKSRVFGVALKDRGAIFPAGNGANAAYWFDDSTGNFITSTFYMNALPQWVQNFNAQKKAASLLQSGWNLSADAALYDQSIADGNPFERPSSGDPKTNFPVTYNTSNGTNFYSLRGSPFGNTLTINFAEQLIQNEKLGLSGQTDMLCVSFSSTDYVGHRFGPQSQKTEDTYLRLDKELESFFTMLDQKLGVGNYTIFLSADHGAPHSPDFSRSMKLPGGTLPGSRIWRELNASLEEKFKVKNLLQNYFEYQLYLDKKRMDSTGINKNDAEDFLVTELLKRPEVVNAFAYRNFDKVILPDFLKQRFASGYYSKRSGDVQMILKPQYTDGPGAGTDHGVWYTYDAHIPLIFYGWGIKPGKTNRETYMTDAAPTLAALLHIQMPDAAVGKVLTEAIK